MTAAGGTPTSRQHVASLAAIVEGDDLTLDRVDAEIAGTEGESVTALRAPARADWLGRERWRVANRMIDDRLLLRAARRARIEVTDETVDKAMAEVARAKQLTIERLAEASRKSLPELRQAYREQLISSGWVSSVFRLLPHESPDQARARAVALLRQQAKVELLLPVPRRPIDATLLLTRTDLDQQLRGNLPQYVTKPLNDLPTSETYDTVHLQAIGKPESYDVAVRVWWLPGAALETQWKELLPLAAGPHLQLGDASFRAKGNDPRGIAVLDRTASFAFLLTCGRDLCRTGDEALVLARLAYARIGMLAALRSPPP